MVSKILNKSDFTDPQLAAAFGHICAMHVAGFPMTDDLAVVKELQSTSSPIVKKLAIEASKIPNVATVQWHAERLLNLSRLRGIHETLDLARGDVLHSQADADDVLGGMEVSLMKLRHGGAKDARRFQEIAAEVVASLEARMHTPDPAVLLSGFPSADNIGFVFGDGEICILAARPGVGKTSLATQIAMHHASRDRAVLIASLEMRDKDLVSRILISSAGHNHQLVRTGRIDGQCVSEIRQAQSDIGDLPLFIWSPGRVKAGVVHALASVFKQSHGLRLLIVDYLGLVRADERRKERYEEVGETMKALRDIGQRLEIPVLCLCQLNRQADGAEPKLSNLRESGDIEQDADIVAFLHPPDPKDQSRVDLIVAKDRQGATGRVTMQWHKAQTMFSEPDVRSHANYNPAFDKWNNP